MNSAVLVAIMLGVVLLFVGSAFNIVTNRELAAGLFGFLFIVPILWANLNRRTFRTAQASGSDTGRTEISPKTPIKIAIWILEIWAFLTTAILPVGIVIGLTHRALLPTAVGAGMSILLIASLIRSVSRLRAYLQAP